MVRVSSAVMRATRPWKVPSVAPRHELTVQVNALKRELRERVLALAPRVVTAEFPCPTRSGPSLDGHARG